MKTPQVPAMPGTLGKRRTYKQHADYMTAILRRIETDEKIVAERKWQQRKLAPAPQQQCDIGLFSDNHKQTELFK